MKYLTLFFFFVLVQHSPAQTATDWQEQANRVNIIRDQWGIPHIYGQTDADAIFGMMYAQCEDDFPRVERNYLDAMGRMAEAYGETYLYHDLRARMFMDTAQAIELYQSSPAWLRALCDGFAAGINFYLHTHPDVVPDLIQRFEPYMPFFFSEGSIGGDITTISLNALQGFYENPDISFTDNVWSLEARPTGSNGISISPSRSVTGNALFLINPHTSFYFRSEQHVNSQEGLAVYGAATWGQFFIYQGFNEHCGWMHTSTYADAIDQYRETVKWVDEKPYYLYDGKWKPVETSSVNLPYRTDNGQNSRTFEIYRTHHGPIIRREGDHWIAFRMMERPVDALRQSFLRTKATSYREFSKTMKIRTNSSNNTVYADSDGNIGYWHGNYMPKRNPAYDYSGVIEGNTSETDWNGLHRVKDLVKLKNPNSGWIQNCNATPFTAAGADSPDPSKYRHYMAPDLENFRGVNAARVLKQRQSYTLDDLIDVANNPFLAAFEKPIPALVQAYADCGGNDSGDYQEVIDILGQWDFTYGESSIATTLAIHWAEDLWASISENLTREDRRQHMMDDLLIDRSTCDQKLTSLKNAISKLNADFGTWKTPWGNINRFQRLNGNIEGQYDDSVESTPVGFTSSRWGSLASYSARSYPNTKKRYGRSGNSFVAVVEFGDRIKARAVVSGGQSGHPSSPHFTDQVPLFCRGQFRDVAFYGDDLRKVARRSYHPGESGSEN